jgi:hypothetical protein
MHPGRAPWQRCPGVCGAGPAQNAARDGLRRAVLKVHSAACAAQARPACARAARGGGCTFPGGALAASPQPWAPRQRGATTCHDGVPAAAGAAVTRRRCAALQRGQSGLRAPGGTRLAGGARPLPAARYGNRSASQPGAKHAHVPRIMACARQRLLSAAGVAALTRKQPRSGTTALSRLVANRVRCYAHVRLRMLPPRSNARRRRAATALRGAVQTPH